MKPRCGAYMWHSECAATVDFLGWRDYWLADVWLGTRQQEQIPDI